MKLLTTTGGFVWHFVECQGLKQANRQTIQARLVEEDITAQCHLTVWMTQSNFLGHTLRSKTIAEKP